MAKTLSKLLASASYSAFRRASPVENVRMGYSSKARRYVLAASGGKVTQRTPSISARAHETLRTRQVHGLASPNKRRKRDARAGYPIPAKTKRRGSKRPLIEG